MNNHTDDNNETLNFVEVPPFWTGIIKDFFRQSINSIESAAKQIITITGIVTGIYFHAITFTDIRKEATTLAGIIYVLPIILWLLSLIFSFKVLNPKVYLMSFTTEEIAKENYRLLSKKKYSQYRYAYQLFLVGIAAVALALIHYLFMLPTG